ncbi:hypothetical protein BJ742DRAFT_739131 [Cladochytrium replicatum]|nr:hypothetical protein BJ742DRAFT_739131 [Cladochytrium replicatum]
MPHQLSQLRIFLFFRGLLRKDPCHPLTVPEIKATVQEYKTSAGLAINTADFEGVEIHVLAFKHKLGEYGGPVRARFLLEAVKAALQAVPATTVGIGLSPGAGFHKLSYVFSHPQKYPLAYVHLTKPGWADLGNGPERDETKPQKWKGTAGVQGSGFGPGRKPLRADGRIWLWYGWPLTMGDHTHYYAGTEKGYSDWPSYLEWEGAKFRRHHFELGEWLR